MRQRPLCSCADTVLNQICGEPMIRLSICLRLIVARFAMTGLKALPSPRGEAELSLTRAETLRVPQHRSWLYGGEPSGKTDEAMVEPDAIHQYLFSASTGASAAGVSQDHARLQRDPFYRNVFIAIDAPPLADAARACATWVARRVVLIRAGERRKVADPAGLRSAAIGLNCVNQRQD